MTDDLTEISQDPNAPLPQVDPNSELVPYRMERTDPGQAPVVTTGYGPRARPPIQPPAGFGAGVGMPDLDRVYQAAFSKLPVNEAIQAVEASTRFVGQRLLAKALSDAKTPEEQSAAYGRYGYLAFKNGVGLPEVLKMQMEQAKMNQPDIIGSGAQSGVYRIPRSGPPQTLVPPTPPKPVAPKLHIGANGEIIRENPDATFEQLRPGTPKPPKEETEAQKEERKDLYDQLKELRKKENTLNPAFKSQKKQIDELQQKQAKIKQQIDDLSNPPPTNYAPKETKAAPTPTDLANPAGAKSTPVITHRYDPDTGKFTEVK